MVSDNLARTVNRLVADRPADSDADLLRRFVAARDEAAFAALVRRHGPMVFGVCRRGLGHAQDSEDAFQATFLVLARKAHTVRGDTLSRWLYGVAVRVSNKARVRRARRLGSPAELNEIPSPSGPPPVDWLPLFDYALARLPERDRGPILLCDLLGRSRAEAAAELGLGEGTLSSRLARARLKLRAKLTRLGIVPSVVTVAALAPEPVPAALLESTGAAATPAARILAEGVLRSMAAVKLTQWAVGLCVAGTVTAGIVWLPAAGAGPDLQGGTDAPMDPPPVKEAPVADGDLTRIQGTWVVESVAAPDEKFVHLGEPRGWKDAKGMFMTFSGERVRFALFPNTVQLFYLDPSRSPKRIDFTFRDLLSPASTNRVFESARPGIYEFDGDRLRIVVGDPDLQQRPNFFERPEPRSPFVHLTLRRPNAEEQKRLERGVASDLEGTWAGVLETVRGQERAAAQELKLELKGDQFRLDMPGGNALLATFRVDLTKTPWHIDLTATADGDGVKKGTKLMGIIAVDGTFLNLAFGPGERPSAFESAGKNGTAYLFARWVTAREAMDLLRPAADPRLMGPNASDKRIRDLQTERVKALEEQLGEQFERVKIGKDPLATFLEAVRELGEAELELAGTREARTAAVAKMVRQFALCETQMSQLQAAGLQTKEGVAQARAARLKAEIELEKLKSAK